MQLVAAKKRSNRLPAINEIHHRKLRRKSSESLMLPSGGAMIGA
jgi:hypothetical protein